MNSSGPNLEHELEALIARHLGPDSGTPPHLKESIGYSLLAPGKRIRPRIALACGEMLGLSARELLPQAVALEMIHCFTLIHDDLPCMDDDDFRRGKPSNHKKFGEALALLAGDGLLAFAFEVFLDSAYPAERALAAMKVLAWASGPKGVIGGQAAESLLKEGSSLSELRQMHARKTGALFLASVLVPAHLAGLSEESADFSLLNRFGQELGLAFQALDDLEDQIQDHKAAPSPRSILNYLDFGSVKKQTFESLASATQALQNRWGSTSEPLVQISNEVMSRLRAVSS